MKLTFYSLMVLFMMSTLIMMMASLISKKTLFDREKNSPFECGFDPKNKTRLPFSIRFFLIAVIFLIFDVEIIIMFPMIFSISISNLFIWYSISIYFMIILILGLYYEWKFGTLNWLN